MTNVTVNAPDDPNGTDLPIYEGDDSRAHEFLVPGVYPATDTDTDEFGWVTVWGETTGYPSAGIPVGTAGSMWVAAEGCMMGCSVDGPHNHTVTALTGESW